MRAPSRTRSYRYIYRFRDARTPNRGALFHVRTFRLEPSTPPQWRWAAIMGARSASFNDGSLLGCRSQGLEAGDLRGHSLASEPRWGGRLCYYPLVQGKTRQSKIFRHCPSSERHRIAGFEIDFCIRLRTILVSITFQGKRASLELCIAAPVPT